MFLFGSVHFLRVKKKIWAKEAKTMSPMLVTGCCRYVFEPFLKFWTSYQKLFGHCSIEVHRTWTVVLPSNSNKITTVNEIGVFLPDNSRMLTNSQPRAKRLSQLSLLEALDEM